MNFKKSDYGNCRLPELKVSNEAVLEAAHLPLCPTLNALVALEAVLNPNSDVQPFVDQVLMLARLMVRSAYYFFLSNFQDNQLVVL